LDFFGGMGSTWFDDHDAETLLFFKDWSVDDEDGSTLSQLDVT
jgi:hypothetical protein